MNIFFLRISLGNYFQEFLATYLSYYIFYDGHILIKGGEESLETALICLMKKKRQRDPKARRRGLVASTLPRKCSDEEQGGWQCFPCHCWFDHY